MNEEKLFNAYSYYSESDDIPVIHIDTSNIEEDKNGPLCRIYLNDGPIYENPLLPEMDTDIVDEIKSLLNAGIEKKERTTEQKANTYIETHIENIIYAIIKQARKGEKRLTYSANKSPDDPDVAKAVERKLQEKLPGIIFKYPFYTDDLAINLSHLVQ